MPTPINQLLSQTRYATDGTTLEWDFSFSGGYLLKSHVKARVETPAGASSEVVVTEGMFTGPFTLRILPALPAGNMLVIYRDTPKDLPLVDFTDESGFSEVSLDTNAKQAVFIAAETTDTVKTSTPYEAEQAASQAAIAAGEAQASAIAAAASALLSANEADASEVSATAAAASAVNSANSAASSSAAATAVFNANTTTYTRTLLEDTTANAARATLGAAASGANTDITSLSALTSINGGQLAGMRNRVINGNFSINQRSVSGVVTLAAGAYGHDRWKAGASGCTYTFSTTANVTTLTITAGSLIQVIEGLNLESGTFALSWTGTATGKIGAGSYSAAGVTGAITGGTNTNIEFSTGTLSKVHLEFGSVNTVFEQRPYGLELTLCQRYCWAVPTLPLGSAINPATATSATVRMPVTMRATPTLNAGAVYLVNSGSAGTVATLNLIGAQPTPNAIPFTNAAANWTTNAVVELGGAIFSAEL